MGLKTRGTQNTKRWDLLSKCLLLFVIILQTDIYHIFIRLFISENPVFYWTTLRYKNRTSEELNSIASITICWTDNINLFLPLLSSLFSICISFFPSFFILSSSSTFLPVAVLPIVKKFSVYLYKTRQWGKVNIFLLLIKPYNIQSWNCGFINS